MWPDMEVAEVMGHHTPLKGGDEYDTLTRARRFRLSRAGKARGIKRKFWHRIRRALRQELRKLWD